LRQLAEAAPAASFVISSSWRVHGLPTISKLFTANGCQDLLPRLHRDWATPQPVLASRVVGWDRIREIDAWLNDHDVSVAGALDDDPSIRFRPWGIWVDPSRGLSRFEAGFEILFSICREKRGSSRSADRSGTMRHPTLAQRVGG
jgi:hypothetical protein